MKKSSLEFLSKLLETPSPSSGETAGQRVWLDYVEQFADRVETDTYGNALAIVNPGAHPKIMIMGHADEIGFQIQYIDESGFIYFQPVGGPDVALARGQRVHIHNRNGTVFGVVGSLAIHMQDRTKESKVPDWADLYIDIGAENRKAAEKRVTVGDLITYTVGFQQLSGDIYIARACDNRVGTFIAAEVLRRCSENKKKLKACLVSASTVQEENGLYGAGMAAYSVRPDVALVVDVGQATDIPQVNKKKFGDVKLGKGPILSRGSVNHPVVVDKLEKLADKNKIAFQRGIDPRVSGTDTDVVFRLRGGIPSASIGVPNRYMHTPVEAIHLGDLESIIDLLAAFVQDTRTGEEFKVKI